MNLAQNIKDHTPIRRFLLPPQGYQSYGKEANASEIQREKKMMSQFGRLSSLSTNSKKKSHKKHITLKKKSQHGEERMRGSYHSSNSYKNSREKLSEAQNIDTRNEFNTRNQNIQFFQQLNQFPQNFNYNKLKQQLMQEITQIMDKNKTETAMSLREALIKINDNIKKQCFNQFSRQFLPLSFLDDLQRQFGEILDSINKLQQKINQNNCQCKWKQSIKPFQEELNKCSEETVKIKSIIIELQSSIKTIQQKAEKESQLLQNSITQKKIQQILEYLQFSKKTKSTSQCEKDNKENLFTPSKLSQDVISKAQAYGLQKKNCNEWLDQKSGKQCKQLILDPFQTICLVSEGLRNNNRVSHKTISLSYSIDSQDDLVRPQHSNIIQQSMKSFQGIKSSKYFLDNENNLMDDSGKYILNEFGNQIKLTQEQILMIRQSSLLKYKEIGKDRE